MKKYVYIHKTATDGRVFYVGSGNKQRPYGTYKCQRSNEWYDIYEKEGLIVEILHITEDEDEALEVESEYINKYRRICDGGTLVNKATYKTLVNGNKGENNPMFGKTHSNRKPVLQYSKDGEFIKEYDSAKTAAKELNLNRTAICNVCNGKYKSASGFIWKYKEYKIYII